MPSPLKCHQIHTQTTTKAMKLLKTTAQNSLTRYFQAQHIHVWARLL